MVVQEAKDLLNQCEKHVLEDKAFGDREILWMKDNKLIADGYFGRSSSISINGEIFKDKDARELEKCGYTKSYARNDCQED